MIKIVVKGKQTYQFKSAEAALAFAAGFWAVDNDAELILLNAHDIERVIYRPMIFRPTENGSPASVPTNAVADGYWLRCPACDKSIRISEMVREMVCTDSSCGCSIYIESFDHRWVDR